MGLALRHEGLVLVRSKSRLGQTAAAAKVVANDTRTGLRAAVEVSEGERDEVVIVRSAVEGESSRG